jgi:hypothetical protein
MAVLPLFLGLAFQSFAGTGALNGSIHVGGHAYRLVCSRSGSPVACVGSRAYPTAVDQFEVLDENNQVQFNQNAAEGEIFTDVFEGSTGYSGHQQLFKINVVTQRSNGIPSTIQYSFLFLATPEGLRAFRPVISCGGGSAVELSNPALWPPMGIALGCDFDAAYIGFTAVLTYDPDELRVVIPPRPKIFHTYPAKGAPYDAVLPRADHLARINAYPDHVPSAHPMMIAIVSGQTTRVLGAWCPISLETDTHGRAVVHYDASNLWIQIELDGSTHWIHGDRDFRAIGLQSGAENKR